MNYLSLTWRTHLSFLPCVIVSAVNQLVFQGTKETLRHGIVVAVPLATHAALDPMVLKQPEVKPTGVLNPPVTMVNEPRRRLAQFHCHHQSLTYQLLRRTLGTALQVSKS